MRYCALISTEVNKRDYRAWYGLGQTYEMLKLHFYCLYYYKRAQELRPHDSRMLVALGECYERMDRQVDAMKCYWKAHNVGDMEGGKKLLSLQIDGKIFFSNRLDYDCLFRHRPVSTGKNVRTRWRSRSGCVCLSPGTMKGRPLMLSPITH